LAVVLVRYRVNPAWLVAAGAVAGILLRGWCRVSEAV
jgi:hypothetical protein